MRWIIFIAIIFCSFTSSAQHDKIVKANELKHILSLAKKKNIYQLERSIALAFHRLYNEYRIENKLDTVQWSDILWLAGRNHNVYMLQTEDYGHIENEKLDFFSGKMPDDRIDFVQGNKRHLTSSGEGIVGFHSEVLKPESNIEEWCLEVAKEALYNWKTSPKHNETMLETVHQFHAVSFFVIDNWEIIGTHVYGVATGE